MKKLIAGLSLVALVMPSAQAWAVSADDIRTAKANKQRPVVRMKQTHNKYKQAVPCVCETAQATGWQRSAKVTPVTPPPQMPHQVRGGAVSHPLYVNNVQRVVSEKVYIQKVTRPPVTPETCALRR